MLTASLLMVFYLLGHLQFSSEIAQNLAAYVGKDDTFCFAKEIIVIYGSQKVYFIQFQRSVTFDSISLLSITIIFKT